MPLYHRLSFHRLLKLRANHIIILLILLAGCYGKSKTPDGDGSQKIKVNQVGYLTSGTKQAVVVTPDSDSFAVVTPDGKVKYESQLLETKYWDKSDEFVAVADFSGFQVPGTYQIQSGNKISPVFEIGTTPYMSLLKGSVKSYFFNRASSSLEAAYSGHFKRDFSHPDTAVLVHASAASGLRPTGTKISTPYGWYDAGDYNKYVVNSGITLYTLLLAYEHNTTLFDTLTWNIPESNNQVADLMDEIMWNVKWMEQMQDPADGGVYHKTTTADFEGFIAPEKANATRYVVAKSTAATLDFASVMARVSMAFRSTNPQYAAQLLEKAQMAWEWAENNPRARFKNPGNQTVDAPAINTGEYGDKELKDEFFWAATELYNATLKPEYKDRIVMDVFEYFSIPSWTNVETLGLITLANTQEPIDGMLRKAAADRILSLAEELTRRWTEAPYRITLNHFVWGSNSTALNESLILTNAYKLFGNREYFDAALSGLDYVLGRNATNYCFVTGFGSLSPRNIHHRQSASDGIEEPIPGFLVGGPNPRNIAMDCGKQKYPDTLPAKCYWDELCSYSTNEVAINWNAPLVYLASTLQTIYHQDFNNTDL